MAEEVYPINIWINEERLGKLKNAGLADMTKDVLAGLRVIQVPVKSTQKEELLKKYPTAKCDTATTKTIELLPRAVKDKIFDLAIARKSLDVMEEFLKN